MLHGLLWILTRAPHAPDVPGARGLRVAAVPGAGALLAHALDLRALAPYPRLLPVGGADVDGGAALLLGLGHLPLASLQRRADDVARLSPSDAETVVAMAGATTLAAAAAALFVHRNTLVQRLARIGERTGLDPRVPTDLAALRLGLLAREALGEGAAG
ncbi:helix-turn-helix domain-containing protein [Serinibacter arcticus]|uniref:helix-turn-helix domain-containing protein n=1 Tax=Serinibacter arcticus TaxID=1655435 RepID=UPI001F32DF0D|nr:helix-turn-helix domain-containing protein [Serinibacter arcticus]